MVFWGCRLVTRRRDTVKASGCNAHNNHSPQCHRPRSGLATDSSGAPRTGVLRNGAGRRGGEIAIVAPKVNQRPMIAKNGLALGVKGVRLTV